MLEEEDGSRDLSNLPLTNHRRQGGERRTDSARIKVPGVRRVWGTKKDAHSGVILQTVRQLTKADSEKRLMVKRKFKEGGSGRRDKQCLEQCIVTG